MDEEHKYRRKLTEINNVHSPKKDEIKIEKNDN